jgi:hypothetical protein
MVASLFEFGIDFLAMRREFDDGQYGPGFGIGHNGSGATFPTFHANNSSLFDVE